MHCSLCWYPNGFENLNHIKQLYAIAQKQICSSTHFWAMILGLTVTRFVLLPTSLLMFPVVGGRLHLKLRNICLNRCVPEMLYSYYLQIPLLCNDTFTSAPRDV